MFYHFFLKKKRKSFSLNSAPSHVVPPPHKRRWMVGWPIWQTGWMIGCIRERVPLFIYYYIFFFRWWNLAALRSFLLPSSQEIEVGVWESWRGDGTRCSADLGFCGESHNLPRYTTRFCLTLPWLLGSLTKTNYLRLSWTRSSSSNAVISVSA